MLRIGVSPFVALLLAAAGLGAGVVSAQVLVKQQSVSVSVGQGEAKNESGVVDESVEIEGILIINGELKIDGVLIPRGVKKYRSAKNGKVYRIEWGKGDNVSVSEQ